MRVVIYIFLFLFTFIISFIAFMPKKNIYFYIEKELNKNRVLIYNEKIKETPIELDIKDGIINYQGLDIAKFNDINFKPYLFINTLKAKGIKLLDIAKEALDLEIDSIVLKETLLKPFIITIQADGNFGKAIGYIDLKNRLIHIEIVDAQNILNLKRFLRKNKKGWYYERKF